MRLCSSGQGGAGGSFSGALTPGAARSPTCFTSRLLALPWRKQAAISATRHWLSKGEKVPCTLCFSSALLC